MLIVVSDDLPTVAMFVDVSRAYAFKKQLEDLQFQAEVVWTMREVFSGVEESQRQKIH